MFTRSAEEKYVATLICASIEHYAPRHEELWVSQQLRHSQFASLAEDAAWLEEFELVMQKVRQDSK